MIHVQKQQAVALALVILSSLIALLPYFSRGIPRTYDSYHRLSRAAKYYVALHQHQIPPRWIGTVDHGVGSPIFGYLYPLGYVITALLHMGGVTLIDAMRFLYIAGFMASGLTMYLFLRTQFSTLASLTGALLYQWAPYRTVQLYVRGAPEEIIGYALVPLIFLSLYRIYRDQKHAWFVCGLLMGLLILTIGTVTVLFMPLLVSFVVGLTILFRKLAYIRQFTKSVVLAVAIGSIILIPYFFERSLIQLNNVYAVYKDNFISLSSLIHARWTFVPTPQELGKPHLLVLALSAYIIFKRRIASVFLRYLFIMLIAWAVLYLLLAVDNPFTRTMWQHASFLKVVYVPTLLLGPLVFFTSTLAAFLISLLRYRVLLSTVLVWSALVLNISAVKAESYMYEHDANLYSLNGTTAGFDEFLPVAARKFGDFFIQAEALTPVLGSLQYTILQQRYHSWIVSFNAASDDRLIIHQLYFPGWRARIDDRAVPLAYTMPSKDEAVAKKTLDQGLMMVSIPRGVHTLTLEYKGTLGQKAGELITGLGLVFIAGYGLVHRDYIWRHIRKRDARSNTLV